MMNVGALNQKVNVGLGYDKKGKVDKSLNLPINSQNKMTRSSLVDTNYNQLLVKKSAIAFKGLPVKSTVNLDQKISSVLQQIKFGEVCVVSDKADKAQKTLKNTVDAFGSVIKKLFVIEEPGFNGTIAITKSDVDPEYGAHSLINLGRKNVVYQEGENKVFLGHKEKTDVYGDTLVSVGNKKFSIVQDDENDLSFLMKNEVKTFDFSKDIKNIIKSVNSKNIDKILASPDNTKKVKKIMFSDVGGQDKAVDELKRSIIYPLKYPEAFKNIKQNKGTVLTGGPGTGKSLAAEAAGNEADAHFMKLNGLELESKWVGESEENWRNLFQEAKEKQPTVMFIDEFDAVAGKRGASNSSKFDDKVVNQILTLMSDLEKNQDDVHVVVATNRLDILDDAITRSGRFGKHIQMEKPDLKGTKQILDIHLREKPLGKKVNKEDFAKKLFDNKASGADIEYIANEAHKNAFNRVGVYEKMEKGTFKTEDIENLKVEPQDLNKALDDFAEQVKLKKKSAHKPIKGFDYRKQQEPKQQMKKK